MAPNSASQLWDSVQDFFKAMIRRWNPFLKELSSNSSPLRHLQLEHGRQELSTFVPVPHRRRLSLVFVATSRIPYSLPVIGGSLLIVYHVQLVVSALEAIACGLSRAIMCPQRPLSACRMHAPSPPKRDALPGMLEVVK